MRLLREDLVEDIREGVAIALQDTELYEEGYVDDIKLNKLAYFAILDFNLPLTYGWYKYGPAPVVAKGTADTQTVLPQAREQIDAPEESRVPTLEDEFRSPWEYSLYFQHERAEDFEEIVCSDTKEYLIDFYDEYADEEYAELYIASAKLQRELDTILDGKEWLTQGNVSYPELKDKLWELNEEMVLVETVEEAVSPFRNYTDLIEDIIVAAEEREGISNAQQRFIERVVEFFYGGAWEYAALLVSEDTVTGPERTRLKSSIEEDLRDKRETFEEELTELRQRAETFGLLPDHVEERLELQRDNYPSHLTVPDRDGLEAWERYRGEIVVNDNSE